MLQLRMNNIQSPSEVEYALLENSGSLTIIKKKDCLLNIVDPLIQDGKINDEAIKKYHLNKEYIINKITSCGYESEKDIFLALDLKDSFFIVPKSFQNKK